MPLWNGPPHLPCPLLWDPDFSRSHANMNVAEPLFSATDEQQHEFVADLAGAFFYEHLSATSQAILASFEDGTAIRTRSIHDERQ